MRLFYTLILISFSINADPIKIDKSEIEKFGCTYENDDYFSRENINSDRVFYSQSFMDKITGREEALYNYLKINVSKYHYSSEESVHSPGYSFDKYYFEYQGDKITVYRSIHKDEQKTIGFCFEGKFSNELVKDFFSIETIEKIKMDGDGEFYLTSDANSIVKFVRINNIITHIYIYTHYD